MEQSEPQDAMKMLSRAVQRWHRDYEVKHDDHASHVVRHAVIALFNDGYRSEGDIATLLIGTYVGLSSTKVNALTSSSVH
ncbi:hypothetical protein HGP14_32530 [Rhizobium sp. P32RR-XVIII]|uniref:hypothetical protein n=1 Tax=Rhizobium sp. P32RR-XVIII TaxID=2726738 RepID=UPI001456FCD1|nr:hypothetical protein [Rhizobium sp. P32RR-XVIII]NLS07955.1 hypothetical protein [Rhizobium sp. P32RR-XVIII]